MLGRIWSGVQTVSSHVSSFTLSIVKVLVPFSSQEISQAGKTIYSYTLKGGQQVVTLKDLIPSTKSMERLKKAPQTQKMLKESLTINLKLYLAFIVPQLIAQHMFGDDEESNSYANVVATIAWYLIVFRLAFRMKLKGALTNSNMAAIAAKENPAAYGEHYLDDQCGCANIIDINKENFPKLLKNVVVDIKDLIDWYIKWCFVRALSFVPGMDYPSKMLEMRLLGKAILDYQMSAKGLCGTHREELTKQKAVYIWALGALVMGCAEITNFIMRQIGVKNAYTEEAVFIFTLHWFIAQSLLMPFPYLSTDSPSFPKGLDPFYFTQKMTDLLLKKIKPGQMNQNNVFSYEAIHHALLNVSQADLTQNLLKSILSNDLYPLKKAMQDKTIKTFLDRYDLVMKVLVLIPEKVKENEWKAYLASVLPINASGYWFDPRRHIPITYQYVQQVLRFLLENKMFVDDVTSILNRIIQARDGQATVHAPLSRSQSLQDLVRDYEPQSLSPSKNHSPLRITIEDEKEKVVLTIFNDYMQDKIAKSQENNQLASIIKREEKELPKEGLDEWVEVDKGLLEKNTILKSKVIKITEAKLEQQHQQKLKQA